MELNRNLTCLFSDSLVSNPLFWPLVGLVGIETLPLASLPPLLFRKLIPKVSTHPVAYALLLVAILGVFVNGVTSFFSLVYAISPFVWHNDGCQLAMTQLQCVLTTLVSVIGRELYYYALVVLSLQRYLAAVKYEKTNWFLRLGYMMPQNLRIGLALFVVALLSLPIPLAVVSALGGFAHPWRRVQVCMLTEVDIPSVLIYKMGQKTIEITCLILITKAKNISTRLLHNFAFNQRDIPLNVRANLRYTLRLNETLYRSLLFQFGYSLAGMGPFVGVMALWMPQLGALGRFLLLAYSGAVFDTPMLVFFLTVYWYRLRKEERSPLRPVESGVSSALFMVARGTGSAGPAPRLPPLRQADARLHFGALDQQWNPKKEGAKERVS